jgi:hypothetical protein
MSDLRVNYNKVNHNRRTVSLGLVSYSYSGHEWTTGVAQSNPFNSLLPLLHAIVTFLVDKSHHICGYSTFLFAEALKLVAKGCGCTKVDVERM